MTNLPCFDKLSRLLVELASAVPDGMVCFFVSYQYMDNIVSHWNETGILQVRDVRLLYVYWVLSSSLSSETFS